MKFDYLQNSNEILFSYDPNTKRAYIVVADDLIVGVGPENIEILSSAPDKAKYVEALSIYEFLPFLKDSMSKNFETLDESSMSRLMYDKFPNFLYECRMLSKHHNHLSITQKQKSSHLP